MLSHWPPRLHTSFSYYREERQTHIGTPSPSSLRVFFDNLSNEIEISPYLSPSPFCNTATPHQNWLIIVVHSVVSLCLSQCHHHHHSQLFSPPPVSFFSVPPLPALTLTGACVSCQQAMNRRGKMEAQSPFLVVIWPTIMDRGNYLAVGDLFSLFPLFGKGILANSDFWPFYRSNPF